MKDATAARLETMEGISLPSGSETFYTEDKCKSGDFAIYPFSERHLRKHPTGRPHVDTWISKGSWIEMWGA